MRKIINVFLIFFCVISIVLALAFLVIEGRLLFAGDWIVYDNALNGLVRYLLRFMLALFVLFSVVCEIINLKKQNQTLSAYLFFAFLSLVFLSIVLCVFATNFVGVICLALSTILCVLKCASIFLNCSKN